MAQSNRVEVAIGWTLAVGLHPLIAWRVCSRRGRLFIVLGYFTAAYVAVMAVLLLLVPPAHL